jgi:hypothetical protein
MTFDRTGLSTLRRTVVVLGIAGLLAGCTSSTATTPPTAAPTTAPTAVVTEAPTTAPTTAPTATPTAAPTATSAATDTPVPASPTPAPTSPVAACTGNAANKAFILEAASKLKFAVYCAVLPSTWWIQTGKYTLPNGGTFELDYKNAAGATLVVQEGAFCPECAIAADHHYGAAAFGDLAGDFWSLLDTWIMVVGPMSSPKYMLNGRGMTKANFMAWSAAFVKVPKP